MKRRHVLVTVLSLLLAVSLLAAPALADKGKEPEGKGKQESGQSAAYEAGFALGQTVAKVTAVCIAVVAVGGTVIGVVSRSRSGGRAVQPGTERAWYYRPAAKGESRGHLPGSWGEAAPVPPAVAAATEEPAPVHPGLGDNPFALFDEFFGGAPAAEDLLESPEDAPAEDEEPGDVNFKI